MSQETQVWFGKFLFQKDPKKEKGLVPVLGSASIPNGWKLKPGPGSSSSLVQSGFGFSQVVFWSFRYSFTNLSPVWFLDSGSVRFGSSQDFSPS